MYTLIDMHNDRSISRHRTLEALAKAEAKHARDIKRGHGESAYIPTAVLDHDGERIDGQADTPSGMHPEWDDLMAARDRVYYDS